VVVIKYSDYLYRDEKIIQPQEYIEWDKFQNNTSIFNEENINPMENYSIFNQISESIKDIDGIEKINYEIFITNNSMQNILEYYTNQLENEGYSLNLEYSGITPSEYYELNYYTYIKGLNGVVIFIKTHEKLTWVLYSNGNILDYQDIINNLEI
jgi:hypothetical protein